ncbi:DUF3299 domain-containing protein [Aquabacterium soli]|uniref:DUF3299 domain-containing protein n=1 Tax=Aquabacterium soli TaxID=2493092 RepID=A0A426VGC9_9BURK|nr:DUF3299 domain-containing protein [Aquabacterium soli]RRS05968.1 DUF3299 domain-containing protein [Aquabacterium soli]
MTAPDILCTARITRRSLLAVTSATLSIGPWAAASAWSKDTGQKALPHIKWSDLVPKGWDPTDEVRKRLGDQNFDIISDSDPRMLQMLKQMREVWDNAPVNQDMDGVKGRIPGYVVPLEEGKAGLKEMLLVPYYGACIHSPPPPANQIIHVILGKPAKGFASMDTVWVTGTLKTFRGDSYMGVSGYKVDDAVLARYVKEKPRTER